MSGDGRFTSESGLMSVLTRFIDLIYAGLLWLLCSIPLVTAGTASSALYYTVAKCIRRERGGVTVSFFRRFKADFKVSLKVWLLCLAYFALGLVNIWIFAAMGVAQGGVLYYISRFYFIPGCMTLPWLFPYISRFDCGALRAIRAAAALSARNLWRTSALAVLLAGFGLIAWLMPLLIPLLPGVCCFLQSMLIEPVFRELTINNQADGNADRWYNE